MDRIPAIKVRVDETGALLGVEVGVPLRKLAPTDK
jgi:hypothetical protein